jgi:heme oxygenase (biliverdin-IX-beta and delta-forming)
MSETRSLQKDVESEGEALLANTGLGPYRKYLSRWFGFVCPVERSLLDLAGLERVLDVRRLHKHQLLEHDLITLGLKPAEIKAVPQCMSVPLFDNIHDAMGWAFLIEHSTLAHPTLFRQLASAMPGEVAFASSYLKCYFGGVGEMWRSFGDGLETAGKNPDDADRIVLAAKASYRHFRRWRATLDGKALSLVDGPSHVRESS